MNYTKISVNSSHQERTLYAAQAESFRLVVAINITMDDLFPIGQLSYPIGAFVVIMNDTGDMTRYCYGSFHFIVGTV